MICSTRLIYDRQLRFEHLHWEWLVERLVELLEQEYDLRSRHLSRTLEQLRRDQLGFARLCDATWSGMVTSDRGFRESNCDGIVLRLDNGDKLNYCVTPEPM